MFAAATSNDEKNYVLYTYVFDRTTLQCIYAIPMFGASLPFIII